MDPNTEADFKDVNDRAIADREAIAKQLSEVNALEPIRNEAQQEDMAAREDAGRVTRFTYDELLQANSQLKQQLADLSAKSLENYNAVVEKDRTISKLQSLAQESRENLESAANALFELLKTSPDFERYIDVKIQDELKSMDFVDEVINDHGFENAIEEAVRNMDFTISVR